MLIRIVHLHFRPEAVEAFERLFARAAPHIRTFKGCHHVELWRDIDDPTRFTTYSLWDSASALDAYRHSDFFATTWAETKQLFADRPHARSFRRAAPS